MNFASEKYLGSDGKDSQIETAQLAGDSSADGSDSNESEGAASSETAASETAAAVSQTGSVAEVADTAMPTVVAITSVSVQEIPIISGHLDLVMAHSNIPVREAVLESLSEKMTMSF